MLRIFLSLFLVLSRSVWAQGGGGISGGGDSFAAEFVNIGYDISLMLEKNPIDGVSASQFLEAVRKTKVNSAYTVDLEGQEVDAINTPSLNHILINRRRWIDTATDYKKRFVLVTHEYLGILKIEDSKYQISHNIFSKIGGQITGLFTCDVPLYVGDELLLDTIKLEVFIFRQEQLDVRTSTEVIERAIPAMGSMFFGYKNTDIVVTLDVGSELKLIRLPYEMDDEFLNSGKVKGQMMTYPSKKEEEINCYYQKGQFE